MATNPQNVSFSSTEELFEFLPKDQLQMTLFLREMVLECLPQCVEKLSYNVPYYKIKRNICFIWPSSVLWGKSISFKGVRFGFNQGYLLRDEINFLDKGNRKQVFWKDFGAISEIDVDILKAYLFEAAEIDSRFKK